MLKKIVTIGCLVLLAFSISAFRYLDLRVPRVITHEKEVPRRAQLRIAERGVYLTAGSALDREFLEYIVRNSKLCGLNSVVIEVKTLIWGNLKKPMKEGKLFEAQIIKPSPSLKRIIDYLHSEGMIVSGRMVIFKDDYLALTRPDLAIKDENGNLWRDRGGAYWVDPYSDEVWEWNLKIAELAAWSGIDEIQFDYVRFPTEGKVGKIVYPHLKEGVSHPQNIAAFVKEAKKRLTKYNVALSADIFGVVAWQNRGDIEDLGQDLSLLKEHLDAVCPMLYPSHFAPGYDGFEAPGDAPYYFIQKGIAQLKNVVGSEEANGRTCKIVPWIQGFDWGTTIFGPDYIRTQVMAARHEGVYRFLVWNANNAYAVTFKALLDNPVFKY